MGQLKLPPELATKKVKSLSGESAKLVEELLKAKFDLKEEVAPKLRHPFQGQSGPSGFFGGTAFAEDGIEYQSDVDNQRRTGRRFDVRYNPYTGGRVARAYISTHGHPETGIAEAMAILDEQNITSRGRKIHIHGKRMNYLKRDPRTSMRINHQTMITEIYGCEVVVVPQHFQEMIEVHF